MDILADTSGAPTMLKGRAPRIAHALKGGRPEDIMVTVDLVRKDLRTMLDEAHALGADLPLVARALEIYDCAAHEGWGGYDVAVLPSYWPTRGKR